MHDQDLSECKAAQIFVDCKFTKCVSFDIWKTFIWLLTDMQHARTKKKIVISNVAVVK